ncbi:MAG: DUF4038 domain-containing protein [Planctomycetota bacterium]
MGEAEGQGVTVSGPWRTGTGRLIDGDGRPVFLLADTAWRLFAAVSPGDIEFYLETRAKQGFNAVLVVGYYEHDCRTTPMPGGAWPMLDGDPARPNPVLLDRVEAFVDRAAGFGLTVGFLPTWGHLVTPLWAGGEPMLDAARAATLGEVWADRLGDRDNLFWVIGGDRPAEDEPTRSVWRAMAEAIRGREAKRHLMTFHPPGSSSSSDFLGAEGEAWLDLHAQQSGHAHRDPAVWERINADREATDRPVLDLEMPYEDHPIGFTPENGRFTDHDVRSAAYRGVFAGGCGVGYGAAAVWQFCGGGPDTTTPVVKGSWPSRGWRESLSLPGAGQMRHLRELMESLPAEAAARYDPHAVPNADPHPSVWPVGCRVAADHGPPRTLLVYFPFRQSWLEIDTSCVGGGEVVVAWIDPRNGASYRDTHPANPGRISFTPPPGGPDWVLRIDRLD